MKTICKINLISGLVAIAISLTSCLNDFLEPQPLNQITNQNYWQTENDARSALNAAYSHLQNAYKTGYWFWYEARGDNMFGSTNGSFPYQGVCFNNITSSYPCCNWNNWYKMVSVANYGIHFIPTMTDKMTETNQRHMLSEAYFLRAFAYFNLTRIWGDVPLVIEPVIYISDLSHPYRVSKDTVMQQIISDLDTAMVLVDEIQTALYTFSPGALYALATDVAMWNHDYERALECSQKLIDLDRYFVTGVDFSKVCEFADTYDNIFTLKWNYSTNGANSVIGTVNGTGGQLFPTKEIYEKWTAYEKASGAIDLRRVATIDSMRISGYGTRHVQRVPSTNVRSWKWSPGDFRDYKAYYETPITIYRMADILLLRAEAFNKLGNMESAVESLNVIRNRAGMPDFAVSDFENADALEDALLQERQFELYLEGKRWFDLVRTGKVESVMNTFFTGYITQYGGKGFTLFSEENEWQKYWPVHLDIINENHNITQTGEY